MATTRKAQHREVGRKSGQRPALSLGRVPTDLPMLRTSERGALKRCEFSWDITYNHRVKGQAMPALRFGTLIHKALAAWYPPGTKRGKNPAHEFERLYAEDLKRNESEFGARLEEDDKWVSAAELGPSMLNNYLDEYGSDDEWHVLVTEHPFKTLVRKPDTTPWFWYTGVLDGIWRNRRTKELWIPDHKTTAGLGDSKLSYLQMDDQAGAYWSFGLSYLYAEKFLKPTQKLNGMLYNFLRKALPDERPSKLVKGHRQYLNKDGSVSKVQPSPYFHREMIFRDEYDRNMTVKRAMNDFSRIEMLRSGELTVSKNPGMFTCPMCAVRDICELHETGNDWEEFLRQTTQPWDPYAEHEVYDGR